MKPVVTAVIIALSINAILGEGQPDRPELEILQQMRLCVKKDGIAGFLVKAKAENWRAPHIYSAYWVEQLPPDQAERAKLETERRRFGAALAETLDDVALKLVQPAIRSQRESQVEEMLSLAEWIRTERGYGNLLLFNRAQNLAAIPFAHLVADLECPLTRVEALKSRFSSQSDDQEFRIAVLNEESPTPYFKTNVRSSGHDPNDFELFWSRNVHGMASWAATNDIRREFGRPFRIQLPPEYAFYCDDESTPAGKPRTTAILWELKRHESVCIYGTRAHVTITAAEDLYLVRRELGGFPTNPPSWYKIGDNWTPTQAAFEKACRGKSCDNLALSAASTYDAVKINRFMDWETSELLESLNSPKKQQPPKSGN